MPLVLASLAVGLHVAFFWPGLHPSLWEDCAVAAGLRYPSHSLSGLFLGCLSILYAALPPAVVETGLRAFGLLSAGVLAFLAYGVLDDFLPQKLRPQVRAVPGGLFLERGILFLGAALFVFSGSVWQACQAPGVALFRILCTLLAFRLSAGILRKGRYFRLQGVALLLGLTVADGVFSLLLFLALVGVVVYRSHAKTPLVVNPIANPLVIRSVLVRMAFVFVVSATVALATNYALYTVGGGVARAQFLPGDVASVLLGDCGHAIGASASTGGWLILLDVVAMPLVVVGVLLRRREQAPAWLSRVALGVFLLTAALLWALLFDLFGLRLTSIVCGAFPLSMVALAGAVTVTWAFGGLVVGLGAAGNGRLAKCGRLSVKVLAAAMLLWAVPSRIGWTQREMMAVVDAYCREVVREADEDRLILTDGTFDAGVELAANREGRRLTAVSMVSGEAPLEVKLRQRGVEDPEDLKALESGAADALRYWMDVRTNRLAGVAAQLGFDRRHSHTAENRPRASGLLAHFGGSPGEAEREGVRRARKLGGDILGICESLDPKSVSDQPVVTMFRMVQWRIAEMCRSRVRLLGIGRDTPEKAVDRRLGTLLDAVNPELGAIKRRVGWQSEHHGAMLLPREGLEIALSRHDFKKAGEFAETVLQSDPGDPQANFALGMLYFFERSYARSLPYLTKALEREGSNPQLLSNLSVVCLRLNRLKEALEYAERALQLSPGDRNLMHNAERVRQRIRDGLGEGKR